MKVKKTRRKTRRGDLFLLENRTEKFTNRPFTIEEITIVTNNSYEAHLLVYDGGL